jgi:hypothetical protein
VAQALRLRSGQAVRTLSCHLYIFENISKEGCYNPVIRTYIKDVHIMKKISNRLFFSMMVSFSIWGISFVIYFSNFRYPYYLSYYKYYGFPGAVILYFACFLVGSLVYLLWGLLKKKDPTKPSLYSGTKYNERLEICKVIGFYWAKVYLWLGTDRNVIYVPLTLVAFLFSLIFIAPLTYLLSAIYCLFFVLPEHPKFQKRATREAKLNYLALFLKISPFLAAGFYFYLFNSEDWVFYSISVVHKIIDSFGRGIIFSFIQLSLNQGVVLTISAICLAVVSLFSQGFVKYVVGACWIMLSLIFILPSALVTQLTLNNQNQALASGYEMVGLVICGAVFLIVGVTMLIDRE